jgi:mono/diheme cytochrome c family protein
MTLVAFGGILVGGCGGGVADAPPAPSSEGRAVYAAQTCGTCHGQSRQGSNTAPPLRDLAANWNEETLVAYLRDPLSARAGNPRLEELARRWTSEMPATQFTDGAKLRSLVRYLLESR